MGKFPLAEHDEGLSVAVQRVASGNVDVSHQLKKAQLCAHFCELVLNWSVISLSLLNPFVYTSLHRNFIHFP